MFKKSSHKGFTIIEVLLALSITAALVAAIMSTVQVSINRQRYKDAIVSFQDVVRKQYNQLNSVSFDKTTDNSLADISGCSANGLYGGGRSNCLIVGKIMQFDGSKITVSKLFYRESNNASGSDFDNFFSDEKNQNNIEAFNKMDIRQGGKKEEYLLEWGSEFKNTTGNDLKATVLLLKSPSDGSIRTYARTGSNYEIPQVVASVKTIDFCIHPTNNPYGSIQAVRINKMAANSSGVELMPTDEDIVRSDGSITRKVVCSTK